MILNLSVLIDFRIFFFPKNNFKSTCPRIYLGELYFDIAQGNFEVGF